MAVERMDPYFSFMFRVEIENIIVANVSEVRGLQIEIETEPYEEGGVNDFVHHFPKKIKYNPLVLKRGIADLNDLWNWYKDARAGKITRKNVAIVLMDSSMNDKWRWDFKGAYPVKWVGPELKADSNTIAFESIELVHQGIIDK
jgi:phage tail-like protein